ncbi:YadA-like family protein [Bartonella sp. JB15]|uniref:YadA-like family protein n=1 Tax=Bartonella sp. JB15 TaxID=1933906 RepID=UPI003FA40FBF
MVQKLIFRTRTDKDGQGRTLSGLKDGKVSAQSTEAITGKQLYETNTKVAEYLGGGANSTTETAPTYNIRGKSHRDVGSAFVGVNDSLTDIYSQLTNVEGGSLVQQEESEDDSGRITIGAKVGGTEVNFSNKDGQGRTLSGLKDGKVSAQSTEAITGGQLYETNTKVAEYLGGESGYAEGEWTAPTFALKLLREDGSTEEKKYNNVADSLKGLSESFVENNLIQKETSEREDVNGRITIGAKVGGTEINLSNKDGQGRTLSGLKDGKVSEQSTEAITGKQLFKVESEITDTNNKLTETNQKLSDLSMGVDDLSVEVKQSTFNIGKLEKNASAYLGGGADLLAETAPTYEIQGELHRDVGSAFVGVDDYLTKLKSTVNEGIGNIEQNSLLWSDSDDAFVALHVKKEEKGEKKERSKLKFLLDGDIAEASTEAVTGGQLYETNTKVAEYLGGESGYAEGEWTAPTFALKLLREDGSTEEKKYNNVADSLKGLSESFVENNLIQKETSEREDVNGRITIGAKVVGTEVNFSNKDGQGRTLSGLKDGKVSAQSTEAITGKQLYETNTKVAEYLGGGANSTTETAPTYNIRGKSHRDVGSAFVGVNDSLTDIYSQLTNVEGGSLVQQEESEDDSGRITIGAKVGGTEINFSNKDGQGRTLSGLKDGKVSEQSTEAITGKQLFKVESEITGTNNKLTETNQKLSDLSMGVDDLSVEVKQSTFNIGKLEKNASAYLGGGADLLAETAPTYEIQGELHRDVGSAFVGVDDYLTKLKSTVTGNIEDIEQNSLLWSDSDDAFVALHVKKEEKGEKKERSKLKFLLDGDIAEASTEAVTGGQLYETNTKVAEYLGGESGYAEGEWTAPTFALKLLREDGSTEEKKYNNVADSLKGLSESFVENNLIQKETSEREDVNGRITIGAKVVGTEVNFSNKDGQGRTLSGLKDGKVSAQSTEAITGKQLFETNSMVAEYLGGGANSTTETAPTYEIQGELHRDVGSAFVGVDDYLTKLKSTVNEGIGNIEQNSLLWSDSDDAFVALHVKKEEKGEKKERSKLKFLLDGDIAEASTEAVTGGQLYETNTKVAEYLGGESGYAEGEWTAPTFALKLLREDGSTEEKKYNNVADSLKGLSESFVENNLIQKETSEREDVNGRITIGAKVGGTEINLSNKDGQGRTLSGLKDGKVSEQSTEAITGKQLFKVESEITDTNNKLTETNQKLSDLSMGVDDLSVEVKQSTFNIGKLEKNASAYLGGGADLLAETAPTYEIQGELHRDVGSAFVGVDDYLTKLKSTVTGNIEDIEQNSLLWSDSDDAFVALHVKKEEKGEKKERSKLKFLLDGDIAEASTEAVTGGQLYETNTKVAEYLGGESGYAEGEWTAPTFALKLLREDGSTEEKKYNNVADSLKGLSESFVENNLIQKETSEREDVNGRITIGAKVVGTEVNFSNKDGQGRTLSGLKDGKVSAQSTEAITGKQLYETNTKVAEYLGGESGYAEGEWTAPTFALKLLREDGSTEEKKYNNVADSLKGLSESFVENNLIQKETSEREDVNGRITIGAKVGGTEVNFSNKDGQGRTLSGLKDGKVSEQSTEGITGGQLYETNTKVAEYLGGESGYAEGEWTAPTFALKLLREDGSTEEKKYNNVADSLKGLSESFVENNLIQKETSEREDVNGRITIGAKVVGTEVNFSNKDGQGRTLSGLKDGKVSAQSTEAITGKQLFETNSMVAEYLGGGANSTTETAPTYEIQGELHRDVGSAFVGVDDYLTKLKSTVNEGIGNIEQNSLLWSDSDDAFVALHVKKEEKGEKKERSKLKFLLDGDIAEASTEAVTGGQLYETNTKVAEYLGGESGYAEGEWTAPTFALKLLREDGSTEEKKYNNVADSLKGLSESFVENNLIQKETSEREDVNGRITIGAKVGGTEINLSNKDGQGRTLSGLKDGKVSEQSTEAITGKQLFKVESEITDTNNKLTETNQKLSDLSMGVDDLSVEVKQSTFNIGKLEKNASAYLGGGADLLAETAPTYEIQGELHRDVGSAFVGVDDYLTKLKSTVNEGIGNIEQNSLLWSDSDDAFVALHVKKEEKGEKKERSKLKFLLDGDIAEASTEAVTGGQLYETNTKVAEYLGGESGYAEGEWTAPTFALKLLREDGSTEEKKYNNVADSLKGLSESFVENNLIQKETSEREDVNGRITIGAKVVGTEVNFSNKDGQGRTLSGLKDGKVSAQSTEAITGKQLYETNTKVAEYLGGGANSTTETAPTYKIQGELHRDVGSAFVGVDDYLTKLKSTVNEGIGNIEQNSLLWSDSDDAFVALHVKKGEKGEKKERSKLKFLLDGDIAEASTEAVTGGQLYETNTKVAEYLGGEAKYGPDGWIAPTFQIIQFNSGNKTGEQQYKTYNNVADAFGGVNESMKNLNNRVGNLEQKEEPDSIKWNENKGAYDASREEDGKITNSKLTGVADGAVEKGSSDVVTGNQLWETNQKVNSLENKVNEFENSVGQMAESAVQYDKDEDGNKTNKITLVGGDASAPVIIGNVGDGKVEKDSKEAINGGQLYEKMQVVLDDAKKYTDEKIGSAISEAKEYTDMKFDTLSYNLEGVRQEARQAAAIGLAASNLRYNELPGKLSIAFSSGLWRSQSAFAFGAGYTSENGNIRSNISITTAGGNWGIGGGIQFTLN